MTLLGDCIHVEGIPAWGPWDDTRLHFRDEASLELTLTPAAIESKIMSHTDLEAAIADSWQSGRTRTIWVDERLVDNVRTLWEDLLGLGGPFRKAPRKTSP